MRISVLASTWAPGRRHRQGGGAQAAGLGSPHLWRRQASPAAVSPGPPGPVWVLAGLRSGGGPCGLWVCGTGSLEFGTPGDDQLYAQCTEVPGGMGPTQSRAVSLGARPESAPHLCGWSQSELVFSPFPFWSNTASLGLGDTPFTPPSWLRTLSSPILLQSKCPSVLCATSFCCEHQDSGARGSAPRSRGLWAVSGPALSAVSLGASLTCRERTSTLGVQTGDGHRGRCKSRPGSTPVPTASSGPQWAWSQDNPPTGRRRRKQSPTGCVALTAHSATALAATFPQIGPGRGPAGTCWPGSQDASMKDDPHHLPGSSAGVLHGPWPGVCPTPSRLGQGLRCSVGAALSGPGHRALRTTLSRGSLKVFHLEKAFLWDSPRMLGKFLTLPVGFLPAALP